MNEYFPYVWVGIGLFIVLRALWQIISAIRTGEVDGSIWGGAVNAEDHYGFVFRIGGLFVILLGTLFLLMKAPEIFKY